MTIKDKAFKKQTSRGTYTARQLFDKAAEIESEAKDKVAQMQGVKRQESYANSEYLRELKYAHHQERQSAEDHENDRIEYEQAYQDQVKTNQEKKIENLKAKHEQENKIYDVLKDFSKTATNLAQSPAVAKFVEFEKAALATKINQSGVSIDTVTQDQNLVNEVGLVNAYMQTINKHNAATGNEQLKLNWFQKMMMPRVIAAGASSRANMATYFAKNSSKKFKTNDGEVSLNDLNDNPTIYSVDTVNQVYDSLKRDRTKGLIDAGLSEGVVGLFARQGIVEYGEQQQVEAITAINDHNLKERAKITQDQIQTTIMRVRSAPNMTGGELFTYIKGTIDTDGDLTRTQLLDRFFAELDKLAAQGPTALNEDDIEKMKNMIFKGWDGKDRDVLLGDPNALGGRFDKVLNNIYAAEVKQADEEDKAMVSAVAFTRNRFEQHIANNTLTPDAKAEIIRTSGIPPDILQLRLGKYLNMNHSSIDPKEAILNVESRISAQQPVPLEMLNQIPPNHPDYKRLKKLITEAGLGDGYKAATAQAQITKDIENVLKSSELYQLVPDEVDRSYHLQDLTNEINAETWDRYELSRGKTWTEVKREVIKEYHDQAKLNTGFFRLINGKPRILSTDVTGGDQAYQATLRLNSAPLANQTFISQITVPWEDKGLLPDKEWVTQNIKLGEIHPYFENLVNIQKGVPTIDTDISIAYGKGKAMSAQDLQEIVLKHYELPSAIPNDYYRLVSNGSAASENLTKTLQMYNAGEGEFDPFFDAATDYHIKKSKSNTKIDHMNLATSQINTNGSVSGKNHGAFDVIFPGRKITEFTATEMVSLLNEGRISEITAFGLNGSEIQHYIESGLIDGDSLLTEEIINQMGQAEFKSATSEWSVTDKVSGMKVLLQNLSGKAMGGVDSYLDKKTTIDFLNETIGSGAGDAQGTFRKTGIYVHMLRPNMLYNLQEFARKNDLTTSFLPGGKKKEFAKILKDAGYQDKHTTKMIPTSQPEPTTKFNVNGTDLNVPTSLVEELNENLKSFQERIDSKSWHKNMNPFEKSRKELKKDFTQKVLKHKLKELNIRKKGSSYTITLPNGNPSEPLTMQELINLPEIKPLWSPSQLSPYRNLFDMIFRDSAGKVIDRNLEGDN